MALMSSMYTGWSGLNASNNQLTVIGDNIANANTIGFKGSRAVFEEALAQTMMGGQLGSGTSIQTIQRILSQGAMVRTGQTTDLALQGDGYFIVNGEHNGAISNYFTRAGQFTMDKDGYLVNMGGLRVQGFVADALGNIGGTSSDLMVGAGADPPNPTNSITLKGNLDSASVPPPAAFAPPLSATGTTANYNFMQSITIYDSLGTPRQADVYFVNTGAGTWDYHVMTDGAGVTGGVAGTPTEIASGTLTFDTDGKLTGQTTVSNYLPLGATNPQVLTFNMGDPLPPGTGVGGMTQFAGTSQVSFSQQDGYAAGSLAGVQIDSAGKVTGTFTNGQSRVLAQVAVAKVEAPDQMTRLAGNLYSATTASGQASIGVASTGGRGSIVAGALEQSNVDLAEQFIDMIAAQRAFQANSKTIATADQMLQELMTLKR